MTLDSFLVNVGAGVVSSAIFWLMLSGFNLLKSTVARRRDRGPVGPSDERALPSMTPPLAKASPRAGCALFLSVAVAVAALLTVLQALGVFSGFIR
jgi:hypothetical protein